MEQQLQKLTQAILVRGELLKQLEVRCAAIQASVEEMKPKPVTLPAQASSSTPPTQASSSRSLATGELDNLMPAKCSKMCSGDDTASQKSALMLEAAPGPPSTAALRDVVITSTSVLTSTPSGDTVRSIDLGDKRVPNLSSCQLSARKVFERMRGTGGISIGFSTIDQLRSDRHTVNALFRGTYSSPAKKDLTDSIAAGNYTEWQLYIQTIDPDPGDRIGLDLLDVAKTWTEDIIPLQPVGRLVLNKNIDNLFVGNEPFAFCPALIIPGIHYSDDKLLQGLETLGYSTVMGITNWCKTCSYYKMILRGGDREGEQLKQPWPPPTQFLSGVFAEMVFLTVKRVAPTLKLVELKPWPPPGHLQCSVTCSVVDAQGSSTALLRSGNSVSLIASNISPNSRRVLTCGMRLWQQKRGGFLDLACKVSKQQGVCCSDFSYVVLLDYVQWQHFPGEKFLRYLVMLGSTVMLASTIVPAMVWLLVRRSGDNMRWWFCCNWRLDDGRQAAVKKLDAAENEPNDEFLKQVSLVSRLKHENLVEMLGYYVEGRTSFLFTPGNLDDWAGKIQLLLTNKEFRDNKNLSTKGHQSSALQSGSSNKLKLKTATPKAMEKDMIIAKGARLVSEKPKSASPNCVGNDLRRQVESHNASKCNNSGIVSFTFSSPMKVVSTLLPNDNTKGAVSVVLGTPTGTCRKRHSRRDCQNISSQGELVFREVLQGTSSLQAEESVSYIRDELKSRKILGGRVTSSLFEKMSAFPVIEKSSSDELLWQCNFADSLICGFGELPNSIESRETHKKHEANAKYSNQASIPSQPITRGNNQLSHVPVSILQSTYADDDCISGSPHCNAEIEFEDSRQLKACTPPSSMQDVTTERNSRRANPNFQQINYSEFAAMMRKDNANAVEAWWCLCIGLGQAEI